MELDQLFLEYCVKKGYQGFCKDKFYFKNSSPTSSYINLIKKIGILDDKDNEEISKILLKIWGNKGKLPDDFIEILKSKEYSKSQNQIITIEELKETNNYIQNEFVDKITFFIDFWGQGKTPEENIVAIDLNRGKVLQNINIKAAFVKKGLNIHEFLNDPNAPTIAIDFKPFDQNFYIKVTRNGHTINGVNSYTPPEWYCEENDREGVIPEIIEEIFCSLFPIENEREAVFDWFHYALTSRAQTLLYLVGSRGIGKTLITQIFAHIVGFDYFCVVGQEQINNKFNGYIKNKRFVELGEIVINSEAIENKIKLMLNDKVTIDAKFKETIQVDNTVSYIGSSNNLARNRISTKERRFLMPEMSNTKLIDKVDKKRITKLMNDLEIDTAEGKEIKANFGFWLLNRIPKNDSFYVLKNKHYYFLCELNLPVWAKLLLEFIAYKYDPINQEFIICYDAIVSMNETKNTKHEETLKEKLSENYKYASISRGKVVDREKVPKDLSKYLDVFQDFEFIGNIPIGEFKIHKDLKQSVILIVNYDFYVAIKNHKEEEQKENLDIINKNFNNTKYNNL